jgi:hypothetical protein
MDKYASPYGKTVYKGEVVGQQVYEDFSKASDMQFSSATGRISSRPMLSIEETIEAMQAIKWPTPGLQQVRASESGYGGWKYSRDGQKNRAKHAIKQLMRAMADTGARDVCVHGTSGVALMGAILILWPDEAPPNFFMLRKEGEKSHGQMVETDNCRQIKSYIFLDDLIGGGGTCNRVAQALKGAEMVAIVLHSLEDYCPLSQDIRTDSVRKAVKVYGRG